MTRVNLADVPGKPRPLARALIGTDLGGVWRILATDDFWLAKDVRNASTDAEELGMGAGDKPGLYLFTGRCQLTYDYESGEPDGSEWVGELRPVRPEEVAELYAMVPTELSFDDGLLPVPRNFGDPCPACGCGPCACPPGD